MSTNYLTPKTYQKMRDEVAHLLKVERPEVVEQVSAAAAMGDRSENAEYIYGKKRLRQIDSRIRFLQGRLKEVEIVDPETLETNQVRFGLVVEVEDEDGEKHRYQILGKDELSAEKKGVISFSSPVGRALLGKKVGELVTVKTPKGETDYEVLSIHRPSEISWDS